MRAKCVWTSTDGLPFIKGTAETELVAALPSFPQMRESGSAESTHCETFEFGNASLGSDPFGSGAGAQRRATVPFAMGSHRPPAR